jgi:EmrB/QacA subfamily drug resistance transporter
LAVTNRPLAVVALLLSLFMAAMEMTVVSTAMPTAVGDLGGVHLYAWVFSAYLLTATVTVPIYGKLADLYGRKPILLFGIALFLAGSMASGQARTMEQLVVFRALQGLGAGAIQPTVLTLIGDLFDLQQRSRMQGLFGGVWGLAGLIGPALGGWIVALLSWRWIFYINVPFGLLAALLIFLFLHERVERRPHRLDLLGTGLLAGATTALLVAARGGLAAPAGVALGALLVALLLAVERRVVEPILPMGLFKVRAIAVASAAGALVGAGMIATVTFLPLYVQGILGGSPAAAGGAITPMVIGWPLASALGGRLLVRIGFRPLIRGGLALSAAAAIGLAFFLRPGSPLWVAQTGTFFFGAGLGFANTALLIAVQTSVAWEQRGVATSSTMFFRTIGGTLAVGLLGGMLAAALGGSSADQILGPDHGRHLDPAVLKGLSGALQVGLTRVFWAIAVLAVLAWTTSWFFPKLETTPRQPEQQLTASPDPTPS